MPEIPEQRSRRPSDARRGRGYGVMVGSLMAFGWSFYAAGAAAGIARIVAILVAAGITAILFGAGLAMIRRARPSSDATKEQRSANRRVWRWFWINFAGEVILMNLAGQMLAAPHLQVFLVPAISAVVGLHFFPMAMFFRVPSYWWVGIAMLGVAAIAASVIAGHPGDANAWLHGEGLANAFILWAALAIPAFAVLLPPSPARS